MYTTKPKKYLVSMAVFLGQCCKSESDVHTLAVAAYLTKYGHTNAARANSRIQLSERQKEESCMYRTSSKRKRAKRREKEREKKKET